MRKFAYSFEMTSDTEHFHLVFHDFPKQRFSAKTREELTKMAEEFIEVTLYGLLKEGKSVPMPSRKTGHDKAIIPNDTLVQALEFYLHS